jgi:uncharacterized protein (TIGR03067 family)
VAVGQNTIEGRIAEVLQKKRDPFNVMLEGNGPTKLGLTEDEVFGLFDIQSRSQRAMIAQSGGRRTHRGYTPGSVIARDFEESPMKRCALLVVAAVLLVAAEGSKEDASSKDLKKLKGTWTLESGVFEDEKMTAKEMEGSSLVIDGDKHTVKIGGNTYKGTHKLNASKNPKTIDIMDTEGPWKDETVLGIYKIEGDKFHICLALPGKSTRPEKFAGKAPSGHRYHVWKRVVGGGKAAGSAR